MALFDGMGLERGFGMHQDGSHGGKGSNGNSGKGDDDERRVGRAETISMGEGQW